MNKKQILLGTVIVLVLAVSAAWQLSQRTAVAPTETISEPFAAEINEPVSLDVKAVSVTPTSRVTQTSFALAEGDTIASWDFKGAYTDNPELTAKAQNEIARLSELLVTATSSEMILSVGVANQYELLGDGTKQYEYLGRAIQANPENGLPWHNLGVLMERLGALQSARAAYEQSTLVQPEFKFYHYVYIEFLITRMRDDARGIEKAFAAAEKNIDQTSQLLELRAQWQAP